MCFPHFLLYSNLFKKVYNNNKAYQRFFVLSFDLSQADADGILTEFFSYFAIQFSLN